MGFVLAIFGVLIVVGLVFAAAMAALAAAAIWILGVIFLAIWFFLSFAIGDPYVGFVASIGAVLLFGAIVEFKDSSLYRKWTAPFLKEDKWSGVRGFFVGCAWTAILVFISLTVFNATR